MPFGDGTGPLGLGPRTGRGAGYCNGFSVPGYVNRGFGWGFGRGRGWRHWYYATGLPGWARWGNFPFYATTPGYRISPEEEIEILKQHSENLKRSLETIQSRIETLEANKQKKE